MNSEYSVNLWGNHLLHRVTAKMDAVAWAAVVTTNLSRIEDFKHIKCPTSLNEPMSIVFPISAKNLNPHTETFGLKVTSIPANVAFNLDGDDEWKNNLPKDLRLYPVECTKVDPITRDVQDFFFHEPVFALAWNGVQKKDQVIVPPLDTRIQIVRAANLFSFVTHCENVGIVCATEAEANAWAEQKKRELMLAHAEKCKRHVVETEPAV